MPPDSYALIACSKSKQVCSCPAKELYTRSSLFRKAFEYCTRQKHRVWILSAKHGLLDPDTVIEPYDLTLKGMPREAKRAWSARVSNQIRALIPPGSTIELHAGKDYIDLLDLAGYDVRRPLDKKRQGERMQWYDQQRSR